MLTILSFVFVLGILIFIHELGHFLVAKKVGIKVEAFSLGFPPNIYTKKVGDTEYCLGMIPLGGYVKMAGENPNEEATGAEYEFMSKSVSQRAAVIIAGPFMNYLLAIFIFICLIYFSGRPVFDKERILVGVIEEGSPAEAAGLMAGDQIIGMNGLSYSNFDSLRVQINKMKREELSLTWLKGTDTISNKITTILIPMQLESGEIDSIGIIGFKQKVIRVESFGIVESISLG